MIDVRSQSIAAILDGAILHAAYRGVLVGGLAILLAASSNGQQPLSSGPQRTSDQRTTDALDRLLAAGLATTARQWCERQLAAVPRDSDAAMLWTLRLSQAQAARALQLEAIDPSAWQAAIDPLAEQLQAYPNHPRASWLRTEMALVEVQRGKRQILEYLAAPQRLDDQSQGLALIRHAVEALREETKAIETAIADLQRSADTNRPQQDDLQLLLLRVQVHLSDALLARADAFPRGSADAIAAATEAEQAGLSALSRAMANETIDAQVAVVRARAALARGDESAVRDALRPVLGPELAPQGPATASVLLLAAIEQNDLVEAERVAGLMYGAQPRRPSSDPSLDLAYLALLAAQAAQPTTDGVAQVTQWLQQISAAHGPYWRRRGETTVLGKVAAAESGDATILTAQADANIREQKFADAAPLYFRASQAIASRGGPGSEALPLALKGAASLQRTGDAKGASLRFREAANQWPSEPSAPTAHLQAAYLLAEIPSKSRDATWQDSYLQILQEHLLQWPMHESSVKAREWLAKWFLLQGEPRRSAEAWLSTPETSPAFAAAVVRAAPLIREYLRTVTADEAQGAADQILLPLGKRITAATTTDTDIASASLEATSIVWCSSPIGLPLDEDDPIDALARSFLQLAQGELLKFPMDEQVAAISKRDEPWLADVVQRANLIGRQTRGEGRMAIAKYILRLGSSIVEPSPTTQQQLAQAHAWAGDLDAAQKAFDAVIAIAPEDPKPLQTKAESFQEVGTQDSVSIALDAWRQLASQLPSRSNAWFHARLATAQCLVQLQRPAEATKILKYIIAMHPKDNPLDAQYQVLLRQLVSDPR
jgi:hypothetical protein